MKSQTPYYILLVLAVSMTGLMVYYNLSLRQEFAVTVGYTLPQPVTAEGSDVEGPGIVLWEQPQEPVYLYDDYYVEDNPADTVSFPLEINSTGVEQLVYIPRVGEVTALRIVQYREILGGYTQLEQLMDIQGIGEKTFALIEPYLYIEGQWSPEEQAEPVPEE